MKNLTKAMVGTMAAGAMAVSSASPALARDRNSGVDTGDVIAGALIIGGIAAVAAAASKKDRDRYGYRYGNDYRYDRAGYGRDGYRHYGRMSRHEAVRMCVRAVERNASRYGYGRADVTQIRDVERERGGWEVKGRLAVRDGHRGYRHDAAYGRGWNDHRGYDTGKFSCDIRHGRVVDIDYKGIRGLR